MLLECLSQREAIQIQDVRRDRGSIVWLGTWGPVGV